MAENKNSFIFYTEWNDYFTDLSNEEIGEIMRSIMVYQTTGNITEFTDRSLKFVFNIIKNQLDRDAEKWEETKNARSEAGKRGASKRWKEEKTEEIIEEDNNTILENSKNSNAIICHTLPSEKMAKIAVNVNVNDDVNVNANDNVNVAKPEGRPDGQFSHNNIKIPTLTDIQTYCSQKNYVQDAKRFFEYYSQRNWIISGKPVADWTKLCDAWESHEKPKPAKQKPFKKPDVPELPVCSCGKKSIYAQDGVCRCENCIDHYWELESGIWKQINKIQIGIKRPGQINAS